MSDLEFKAGNIKCMGCVNNIKEGLQDLPGIQSVDVSVDTGQVIVSGEALSEQDIIDKLATLGYPVA